MSTILKGRDWWKALSRERAPWVQGRVARQLVVAVVTWLAIAAVFSVSLVSQRIDVSVGDLAPRTVTAPYGVVDWGATARNRQQALKSVQPVYLLDRSVLVHARQAALNRFSLISSLAADSAAPMSERVAVAARTIPIGLPLPVWRQILTLPADQLAVLEQDTMVILQTVMGYSQVVSNSPKALQVARDHAALVASDEEPDPGLRLFLSDLGKSLIAPTSFLNKADTRARQQAAVSHVSLVKILKGETVLVQGQRVTPNKIRVLKELGLLENGFDPVPYVGALLFSAVMVGVVAAYLWFQRRSAVLERSPTGLVGAILVLALAGSGLLAAFPAVSYLMVPTAAIMVAVLYDTGLGLVVAGVLSLASALLTGADVNVALVAFLGSLAGVLGVKRLAHRFDIFWAGLAVGVVNVLALTALDVMQGAELDHFQVWQALIFAMVDGLLAAALGGGLLQLLEGPFGLVTAMKLIDLANPNQPLLRQLLIEAPGTYHHSWEVGNLAEAAAEAVGGNSLLARVGALYHDIGKTRRPYFFVDNQFGGENPHDQLAPSLSAIIISSHVRDGIDLARQHRLPDAIVQFIREHHGTTLIRYFYEKAKADDTGEGVVEEDFRYEGPRPHSKETAIVMLADASEATCRTLKHPTPQLIESTVRRLIKDRLEDGQLDEANLTLKDLDTIARTFTRVLMGVFHSRIEYPDRVLREMERSQAHGGSGAKPARVIRHLGRDGPSGRPPNAG